MDNLKIMPKLAELGDEPTFDAVRDTEAVRRVGVLVLGMHRSGSSAITRMLSLLGCTLPQTPMPVASDNPSGHWESQRVADFNDEILAMAGSRWDDWLPVNPRLPETLVWPKLVERGRELLRQEFGDAPLFVLKDPRICKLGSFWLEVLAAEGIEAACVLPLRNPIEVARSLAARNGIDEHQGLLIWLRHVLAAEAASRGRARAFTEYAALLEHWEVLSARLSAGLDLAWPRVSALSGLEIGQFLTPQARHHVSDPAELHSNPAISPWVRTTYEVLLEWTRRGEKPADHAILDRISREFEDAGTAFARPMLSAARAVERLTQADAERAALAEERDTVARRLGELEAHLTQACAELETRTAERNELADQRATLDAERDTIANRLGDVEAEAARALAERDAVTMERAELAADNKSLVEQRDRIAWRLGEVEADLARACVERDARTVERDEVAERRAHLSEERDRIAWRLGEVEADFARLRNDCDMRIAERDQLANEHARLAEERNQVAWHLGEAEAQLADARSKNDGAHARIDGLAEELTAAHAAAETLKHTLAVAESTLRQREEEIAQLGAELETTRNKLLQQAAVADLARNNADQVLARQQHRDHSIERQFRESGLRIAEYEEALRLATQTQDRLNCELEEARKKAGGIAELHAEAEAARHEASHLSRIVSNSDAAFAAEVTRRNWLQKVISVRANLPRWWTLMPQRWQLQKQHHRMLQRGLFNAAAYLEHYPDVAAAGCDPLQHYILHGITENREI